MLSEAECASWSHVISPGMILSNAQHSSCRRKQLPVWRKMLQQHEHPLRWRMRASASSLESAEPPPSDGAPRRRARSVSALRAGGFIFSTRRRSLAAASGVLVVINWHGLICEKKKFKCRSQRGATASVSRRRLAIAQLSAHARRVLREKG